MKKHTPFEEELRASFRLPEVDGQFTHRLERDLATHAIPAPKPSFNLRWALAAAPVLLALVLVLAVGPRNALAQVRSWLGYLPGSGLVESTTGLRVLAEPVSQTQDGITLTISSGILSPDAASFEVQLSDIPFESHFSQNFGKPVCSEPSYLLLPDGTKLEGYDHFSGIPNDVTEATYVMPCVSMRTLGMAPENWSLPLAFVAAPADLVILPVSLPEPAATISNAPATEQPIAAAPEVSEAGLPVRDILDVLVVVDKPDAWLLGIGFKNGGSFKHFRSDGLLAVSDSAGNAVPYDFIFPERGDMVNQLFREYTAEPDAKYSWVEVISIPKADYAFPLTFAEPVNHLEIMQDVPRDQYLFEFDAGPNPQYGDTWEINQTLTFRGHEVKVLRSEAVNDIASGYCFEIDGGDAIQNVDLKLMDYWSNFSGGSGAPFNPPYTFTDCTFIDPLPTGVVRVGLLQEPFLLVDQFLARGAWSPEN